MVTSPQALETFRNKSIRKVPDFKGLPVDKLRELIKSYTGLDLQAKSNVRRHQLEGLAFAFYMQRCLLLFEMRLGKTMMALTWAEHLKAAGLWESNGIGLIIAHAPIGLDIWESQIPQHSDCSFRIVRTDPDDLIKAFESRPDFIVMTWSGLQAIFTEKLLVKRGAKKGKPKLYPDRELLNMAAEFFSLVIIDEIDKVKNPESLWFELAKGLVRNCRFRLGMTGTPIGRDPFALWAQCYLVDGGETFGTSYHFFEQAYGRREKNYGASAFQGKEVANYIFDKKHLSLVGDKLAGLSMSYSRVETGIEIKEFRNIIELKMRGEQLDRYNDCLNKIIKLGENAKPQEIGNSFSKLRQISAGYLPFIDEHNTKRFLRFKDDAKFEWFADFLSDLSSDLPILIFHEYIHTGELISRTLEKAGVSHARLYGGTPDKVAIKNLFQNGKIQALAANSVSGGTGIDLNRADYVLFFESPSSPITRAQAEARPKGERGDRPLMIDDLICSSIDRRTLGFIQEGKDIMSAISGRNLNKFVQSLCI